MNGSVEVAKEITGKVLASQVLAVIKEGKGNHVSLHGEMVPEQPSYSDAFTFSLSAREERNKTEHRIQVPGWVSGGHTSKRELGESGWMRCEESYRPRKGHWFLASGAYLFSVLSLLPRDAEVAFQVYLDAGTNEYLIRADMEMKHGKEQGLHSDKLYLAVQRTVRGKKVNSFFLIDTNSGPHNSSRFGSPRHERDRGRLTNLYDPEVSNER